MDFQVIFLDDDLLAVNKPAGITVIAGGMPEGTPVLRAELESHYGRLYPVHRLDRDTSGIILFARTAQAHRELNQQFEDRKVTKTYHLLTAGSCDQDKYQVDLPLRVNVGHRRRTTVDYQNGKPARTDFSVIRRFRDGICLLSAQPFTGYTHQIRVHASSIGLWILNDPLYAPRSRSADRRNVTFELPVNSQEIISRLQISRLALHAWQLDFARPGTRDLVSLNAPYPQDFQLTLSWLEKS